MKMKRSDEKAKDEEDEEENEKGKEEKEEEEQKSQPCGRRAGLGVSTSLGPGYERSG